MKQTFNIPEGCKTVSIEQIGNTIVTTFEPEFKKGDFVAGDIHGFTLINIFESHCGDGFFLSFANIYSDGDLFKLSEQTIDEAWCARHATDSEKQILLDKMHESGYDWDAEKCEVVPYKWRPKEGEVYYSPLADSRFRNKLYMRQVNLNDNYNRILIENGLAFKTKEQAHEAAKKMLGAIK